MSRRHDLWFFILIVFDRDAWSVYTMFKLIWIMNKHESSINLLCYDFYKFT